MIQIQIKTDKNDYKAQDILSRLPRAVSRNYHFVKAQVMLMQCNPANSATLNISINHYISAFKFVNIVNIYLFFSFFFLKTYICLFAGKFSVESKISARPTSPKVRESKKLD